MSGVGPAAFAVPSGAAIGRESWTTGYRMLAASPLPTGGAMIDCVGVHNLLL